MLSICNHTILFNVSEKEIKCSFLHTLRIVKICKHLLTKMCLKLQNFSWHNKRVLFIKIRATGLSRFSWRVQLLDKMSLFLRMMNPHHPLFLYNVVKIFTFNKSDGRPPICSQQDLVYFLSYSSVTIYHNGVEKYHLKIILPFVNHNEFFYTWTISLRWYRTSIVINVDRSTLKSKYFDQFKNFRSHYLWPKNTF